MRAAPLFTTPHDAEMAFYTAIAHRRLDALMTVWSDEEEVLCLHPGAPPLTSLESIRNVWRDIFRRTNRALLNTRLLAQR